MKRRLYMAFFFLATGLSLTGCYTYHPRPIDPMKAEADFYGRSLEDPGLSRYIEANGFPMAKEWPPKSLDLRALTLIAFYYHRDLDIARANIAVAEAQKITAGQRPNPNLGISPTYNSPTTLGVSPWTLGFTLDIPIETASKRGFRLVHAQHLSEAARLQLAQTAWLVFSRVRASLAQYLLSEQAVDQLRQEQGVRTDAVAALEELFTAGAVSRPDVNAARVDLSNARISLRAAEGQAAQNRATLASAVGLPLEALERFTFAWPNLASPPSPEALSPVIVQRVGLLNRLDVRFAQAEYVASESALQLEISRQYPDIHLGPGYSWDQEVNKYTVGLSVTLPVFNRNEGPIAEAEAIRQEAGAKFLALQAQAISEIEKSWEQYRAAKAELAEAADVLTGVQSQESAVERALAVGQVDRLALVGMRIQRAVAERARIEALIKTQAALRALEDAVHHPLDLENALPQMPTSHTTQEELTKDAKQ